MNYCGELIDRVTQRSYCSQKIYIYYLLVTGLLDLLIYVCIRVLITLILLQHPVKLDVSVKWL